MLDNYIWMCISKKQKQKKLGGQQIIENAINFVFRYSSQILFYGSHLSLLLLNDDLLSL